jgi:hypothetical protein
MISSITDLLKKAGRQLFVAAAAASFILVANASQAKATTVRIDNFKQGCYPDRAVMAVGLQGNESNPMESGSAGRCYRN